MDTDHVTIIEESVFAVSSRAGNIRSRTVEGLYAHDTRFLSNFGLALEGLTLEPVGANQLDHSMATFYASSRRTRKLPSSAFSVIRDRYVSNGLYEDIYIMNHTTKTSSLQVAITCDADFADVFEVRLGPAISKEGKVTIEEREGQDLCLHYQRGEFTRETWVKFSAEPQVHGKTSIFDVTLPPKGVWKTCVTILPVVGVPPKSTGCVQNILGSPFSPYRPREEARIESLRQIVREAPFEYSLPRLETDYHDLRQIYQQALADLRALRLEYLPGYYILAAGVPWFMTLFGRDSTIAAIQTKILGPEFMIGTLYTLASLQADKYDAFREAEPGKIPHEVRKGELSVLEVVPHSSYFGSVDATPLFPVLLWEAYRWTDSVKMLQQLMPAAEKALNWIDQYGDLDGDGFVEYQLRTRNGLRNQGWKDSRDSISFANGKLAPPPIALCEVQGYVYDAKRKMADLYKVLGNTSKADELELQAEDLKRRFNEVFWMPNEKFFAVALDQHKHRVDSITSNPGHCLWSGIIDEVKAPLVVKRLMEPDMFGGWGIRTLSTEMVRYNPLSYHNGSVWPHDNSLIAAGMAQYGFYNEAKTIALSLFEAASTFPRYRLPELFAGYPRREYSFPAPYPAANSPQAWATGAIIYMLEMLLGISPERERTNWEAHINGISIFLNGVRYRTPKQITQQ
ncbi:MAG: amylo-alpha-1,6-glucosidase [Thaumarchaeota archaeon]|nr:amylo-alpha-1,6-glucosidase [Nitrososphaerota archaeon]MCL5318085.1 amylo-alpha-1,6-glucosidase [Nitrososphaerota archaeon]